MKNPNYEKFLKENVLQIINIDSIQQALDSIKGKNIREARALVILLYYSGARPNEVLKLKGKDVSLAGHKMTINLSGSKNGLPRPFIISTKKRLVSELLKYIFSCYPELYLFSHFKNSYKHYKKNRKGVEVEYTETSDKLRYYFKKWFSTVITDSIPPYYLRHNRFTKMMMKGARIENVRLLKGAKTVESVYPYLHYSKDMAKQNERFID